MLSSIHPLGERSRGNRFSHTAAAFVVGSVLGGLAIGAVLGTLGWVLLTALRLIFGGPLTQSSALMIVAVSGIVALGFELSTKAIPSLQRQVNENWIAEFRGWVYGIGFGLQLGAGIATYITSAAILVWMAAMLFSGSIQGSVLIGASFGLVRGLSIVSGRKIDSPDRLISFHRFLHRSAPRVRLLGTVSLVMITATAAGLSATGLGS